MYSTLQQGKLSAFHGCTHLKWSWVDNFFTSGHGSFTREGNKGEKHFAFLATVVVAFLATVVAIAVTASAIVVVVVVVIAVAADA